jgi:hypothetical protein
MLLLVVLSLYSASEDGIEQDCCPLREANTSARPALTAYGHDVVNQSSGAPTAGMAVATE